MSNKEIIQLLTEHSASIELLKTQVSNIDSKIETQVKKIHEIEVQCNLLFQQVSDLQQNIINNINNQMNHNNQIDSKVNDSAEMVNTSIIQITVDLENLKNTFADLKSMMSVKLNDIEKNYSAINRSLRDINPETRQSFFKMIGGFISKVIKKILEDKLLRGIFIFFLILLLVRIFGYDEVVRIFNLIKGSGFGG